MVWNSEPKALIVSHTSRIGGAEVVLRNLAVGLSERVEVLLFEEGPLSESLREAKVPTVIARAPVSVTGSIYEVGLVARIFGLVHYPKLILQISRRLRRFDCIYVNSHKALIICAACAFFSGKPLIWHQHIVIDDPGGDEKPWRKRISRRLLVAIANWFVSKVICVSEWARDAYIASGGLPDKCTVIYNSISPDWPTLECGIRARRIREELKIASVPVVGVFGRLQRWKGQDKAISVIARVPNAHCIIVGGATFSDAKYEEELRNLVLKLGVSNRVHFLGWRDDIDCVMRAADIVLQTQREPEAFGLVTVEAMLTGIPVIASRLGATTEIVDDEVTGILVDADDEEEFARRLTELIADPEQSRRIGNAARELAERRYSYSRWLIRISEEIAITAN